MKVLIYNYYYFAIDSTVDVIHIVPLARWEDSKIATVEQKRRLGVGKYTVGKGIPYLKLSHF